jgi:propanediol dehydratase small subunit
MVLSAEEQILSIENNVRPNREDRDHILFIAIDVDLESERTIRCKCIKWPDIYSHPNPLGLFQKLARHDYIK